MFAGILKTGGPLDRETRSQYKLTAHVRDAKSKAWECTSEIEITLSDVNDNSPVFSQASYTVSVFENLDVRSLITKVHATDSDLGTSNTYPKNKRDNKETLICFPVVTLGLILEIKAEKRSCLNELDVRKPLVVSISQRSDKLRLYNVV